MIKITNKNICAFLDKQLERTLHGDVYRTLYHNSNIFQSAVNGSNSGDFKRKYVLLHPDKAKTFFMQWGLDDPSIDNIKFIVNRFYLEDEDMYSLLLATIEHNNIKSFKYLYHKISKYSYIGEMELLLAINSDSIDVLKIMIKNGADIFSQQKSFIINAASHNSIKIIKYFEEIGLNLFFYAGVPLQFAIKNNSKDVVKYLKEKHKTEKIKFVIDSSLEYAVKNEYTEIIDELIDEVDIFNNNNSLMRAAIRYNKIGIYNKMLSIYHNK